MRIIIEDPNNQIVAWTTCLFAATLTGNPFLLGVVWGQVPAKLRDEVVKNIEQLVEAMKHPTIEPTSPHPPDETITVPVAPLPGD